ncbi:MAG: hypothetical protein IKW58_03905 [Alphaproteobacteria bacterium]|nr:hypothetical protein [Alphaproteobacteria bacterium]
MVINTLLCLTFVSIAGFINRGVRWDKIIAWIMFFISIFLLYNYIEQIINGVKQGFSFVWNESKSGVLTIDFFPSPTSNQFLVPLFGISILAIFNNNIFRYEERKAVFNSLILINFVSLSLLICAQNYVQLITAIFVSDIVGYVLLKDVDSSRHYVIYNFFADTCLFMVLSMVSGIINSLDISKLFTYEQIGRHKDFVGLVTSVALFIKIGVFSFHGYLLELSRARFQRMSTVSVLFSPLSGILLLVKLHNLLTVSDLFLPLYKVLSIFTFFTGTVFFVLKNNIRQKMVYFNMAFLGIILILLGENDFSWGVLLSSLYIILYLYNVMFFKLYLYQNRQDNVSDMINAKEINTDIMFVILLLLAILTNLFVSIMYNVSSSLGGMLSFYLSIILSLSLAIVLNHIYTSPKARRLDYLNKNSNRVWSFIFNALIIVLASYHFKAYNVANFIFLSIFFIIVWIPYIGATRRFYNNKFLQESSIANQIYYYILAVPLMYISRMLWLMVDTVFSEKIVENITARFNKIGISIFFKFNRKNYIHIILSIILGILIFVIPFLKRVMS